jgi:hypothetical protein
MKKKNLFCGHINYEHNLYQYNSTRHLREKQKLKFSLKIVVILSKKATSENKRQD